MLCITISAASDGLLRAGQSSVSTTSCTRRDQFSAMQSASVLTRFAVLVMPSYENESDAVGSPFAKYHNAGEKSWVWFSTMNRVNSQVQKVQTAILTRL